MNVAEVLNLITFQMDCLFCFLVLIGFAFLGH